MNVPERKPLASGVKAVLVAVGLVAVGLGVVGIFLPLLPTTPFLLLAAACFFRSSDRLYRWLMNHRVLGPFIRNYREHRAITRRTRVTALTLLWATIGYCVLGVLDAGWARALLLLIATAVTYHLLSLNAVVPPPDNP